MPVPSTRRVSSLHARNQHTWPPTSRGSTQRNTAWGSGANNGQGLCPLLDSKIETADEESAQELSSFKHQHMQPRCLETCRLPVLKGPTRTK